MRLVESEHEPVLDLALAALASWGPGTALVWAPDRRHYLDCDVVEYSPEPARLELVARHTPVREP